MTADTEFSFEYGVKKLKSKTQKPSQDPEKSGGLSQLLKVMYQKFKQLQCINVML